MRRMHIQFAVTGLLVGPAGLMAASATASILASTATSAATSTATAVATAVAGPASAGVTLAGWLAWLQVPLSGSAEHRIADWASWHARLMVLGWAVLLPLGALIARYFKVMPRQDSTTRPGGTPTGACSTPACW
jgi:hypothetical protein